MQKHKAAKDHIIFLQNMTIEAGTIVYYLDENEERYNAIVASVAHVRRGSGSVRRVFYLLFESGFQNLVGEWEVAARCTKAEQLKDGLMASGHGGRFAAHYADINDIGRNAARTLFMKFHESNLRKDLLAMHPPELGVVRVCSEFGHYVQDTNVPEYVIGKAFDYLMMSWAKADLAGLMMADPRLDDKDNIKWGVALKDNIKTTGKKPVPLSPWAVDVEEAQAMAAAGSSDGGGAQKGAAAAVAAGGGQKGAAAAAAAAGGGQKGAASSSGGGSASGQKRAATDSGGGSAIGQKRAATGSGGGSASGQKRAATGSGGKGLLHQTAPVFPPGVESLAATSPGQVYLHAPNLKL